GPRDGGGGAAAERGGRRRDGRLGGEGPGTVGGRWPGPDRRQRGATDARQAGDAGGEPGRGHRHLPGSVPLLPLGGGAVRGRPAGVVRRAEQYALVLGREDGRAPARRGGGQGQVRGVHPPTAGGRSRGATTGSSDSGTWNRGGRWRSSPGTR